MEIEMNPSSAHLYHQEMSSQTLESMLVCTKAQQEKKPRPPAEQAQKCPRCDSANTKFCYYNNYSLTQPRYFCKSCRRYWTKGGTLRNVPVGGGCRKNKRSSSSSSSSSSIRSNQDHQPLIMTSNNPNPLISSLTHLPYSDSTTDLSLAFARLHQSQASGVQLGFDHDLMLGNSNDTHDNGDLFLGNPSRNGFLDALRGEFLENTPDGFHGMFYGNNIGNGEMGNVENGLINPYNVEQMSSGAATTAVTVTTVKQESCNGREGENRVLWGFPWQLGGDHGNNMVEVDSGKQNIGWNGLGSTWHGLLNSPLM